ncbi:TldD/PmbA family protein [Halanaerobaculum tunisiense]
MLSQKLIEQILNTALQAGGDFAEVFWENKKSNALSLEDSNLERVKTGYDLGVGVRVLSGQQISYAYTDNLSKDSLLETAKVAGLASQGDQQITVSDLTTKQVPNSHPIEIRPDQVAKKKKVDYVTEANAAALEYATSIKQVQISYYDYQQQVQIANSEGLLVEDERIRTRMRVKAVASDGSRIETGTEGPGLHKGFEVFSESDPRSIGQEAAREAVTMLDADPAPSGQMPVVINNSFGGVLFHEACGHGLEADAIEKGSSVFADQVGEQVASSVVTAVDDATVQNAWGSFNVDDEGAPAQRTVLIKDGILQDYMYDRKRAKNEERRSTGNGRRSSYRNLPLPRMTNTFISPGESDPDKIVSAVDDGLYAKKLSGGQVEPATGEFVFTVAEGYLIKNGQLDRPVRGATLVGTGIDVLQNISMVGNDLELAPGMCGKGGQSIPAAVGQPTLLVDQITVGGTERKGE